MTLPDDPPLVTVIVPMLNESGYIEPCVEGFLTQTYPGDRIEVLVVDGGSTDGSREAVLAMSDADPRVRLVDNPRRLAAAAANIGIENAKGDILCFLSAHGVPDPDYVATSVRLLGEVDAVGVGGRYLHVGTEPRSHAIGAAMASPFGMASPHRSSSTRVEVDTISHPTFVKQALVDVGGYDETLLRNEDYELNHRLRQNGGRLVFCPEISSVYRPRGSLAALRTQFFAYGRWKATVMRRHPDSIQLRHLVPPAAALLAAAAPLLAWFPWGRRLLLAGAVGYAGVLAAAVAQARPSLDEASLPTFLAAFPIMHGAWGAGVWVGLAHEARSARRDAPAAPGPAGS